MPRSAVRSSLLLAGLLAVASSPALAATVELVSRLAPDQVVAGNLAMGAKLGAVRHRGSSVSANGRHVVARHELSPPPAFGAVVRGFVFDLPGGSGFEFGSSSLLEFTPHISPSGRFIAYSSFTRSVVPVPIANAWIYERPSAVYHRVLGGSFHVPDFEMSDRGRFAVYGPFGSLIQADGSIIFGNTVVVGIAPGSQPAQSADGGWVAFASLSNDLSPGMSDTNGVGDVYLWNQSSREILLVSRNAASASAGNRASLAPEVSWDANRIVFLSEAGDLVPGQIDTATRQLFVFDRASGNTALVSHVPGSAVSPVDAPVDDAEISADGRFAVWSSSATDAVAGQSGPAVAQVFLSDLTTGETILVSRAATSLTTGGNGASAYPDLSGDGRYVSFQSTATDLVPGQTDTAGTPDVFLFNRVTGTTWLASRAAGSETTAANGASTEPEVSLDGTTVVWNSLATDLAPGDLNAVADVYAFRRDDDTPGGFFTVPPCRLLDTREAAQGPAMASGDVVVRWLNGRCPIPWTAKALSVNVTAVPSNDGYIVLFPGDLTTPPGNSTLNFRAGRVKANNAVVGLSRDGDATFTTHAAVVGGGTVHLVIDVNGYFE